jgi:hypothetical protein
MRIEYQVILYQKSASWKFPNRFSVEILIKATVKYIKMNCFVSLLGLLCRMLFSFILYVERKVTVKDKVFGKTWHWEASG